MSTANSVCPQQRAADPSREWASIGCRRYIYCIIDCDQRTSFDRIGVGDESPEVFAIPYEGLAAVVSATSRERFEISRRNILAHQHVMETAMERGHTVLPVKFNTIADDKTNRSAESRIVEYVLAERTDELSALLSTMSTRVELGVKGLWTDMDAVFREIVDSHEEIRLLRGKLRAAPGVPRGSRPASLAAGQIRLGELVKNALEAKKCDIEKDLRSRLEQKITDLRKNATFGDSMFANLALLAEKSQQEEIYSALSALEAEGAGQIKIKCVGPVPPANFVELVITVYPQDITMRVFALVFDNFVEPFDKIVEHP